MGERTDDAVFDKEATQSMEIIGETIDCILNKNSSSIEDKSGWILMLFPFRHVNNNKSNLVSNAKIEDIIEILRCQIKNLEAQLELEND